MTASRIEEYSEDLVQKDLYQLAYHEFEDKGFFTVSAKMINRKTKCLQNLILF